ESGPSRACLFGLKHREKGWRMKINKSTLARTSVLLVALTGRVAMAQSTILNIPTTDTVAKGKGYFEFDYLGQLPGPDPGNRFDYFVPRGIVGVANNVEAGVNVNI